MGNPLTKLADGKSEDDKRKATDIINSMTELAKTKIHLFDASISQLDTKLPILDKLIQDEQIKCSVSEDYKNLEGNVKDILSKVVSGDFIESLSGLISIAFQTLAGSYSASQSEVIKYFVALRGAAIVRIDIYLYSYKFESDGLKSITENIFAYKYIVSSVDVLKVNPSTLTTMISFQFPDIREQTIRSAQIRLVHDYLTEKYQGNIDDLLVELEKLVEKLKTQPDTRRMLVK